LSEWLYQVQIDGLGKDVVISSFTPSGALNSDMVEISVEQLAVIG